MLADRIAGVSRGAAINRRVSIGGILREVRRHVQLAQIVGGLARPMLRGAKRLGFKFTLTMAAYDLVRLPKLIAAAA